MTLVALDFRSLTARDRALLKAVAAGRAEITTSCEPDLFIDGLCCCDQSAAHRLARADLIAPAATGNAESRQPAVLTPAGIEALKVTRQQIGPRARRHAS